MITGSCIPGSLSIGHRRWPISDTITPMQINEPIIALSEGTRATWAEVNLARLSRNLAAIRERVAPAKVMIIVKANAYGHGLAEVAKYLAPQADSVGVAVLEEGIYLRELGVSAPIIVLGGIWGDQIPKYLQWNGWSRSTW
jgi:alanine racemase